MKGLSFFVNNELFAVDVNRVEKISRKMTVTKVPSAPDAVIGITNLKGSVVTIFSLYILLGCKDNKTSDLVNAVIFKSFSGNDNQMGLAIDKPGELVEIDDNIINPPSLATGMQDSFCISGIAEFEDRLYRIIDIDSIINRYKSNESNGGTKDESN
ncbi:MAG: chemotaxis protein CheW [Treponema sp.]|nr:chemotaxis protein CheW [Treponema sp.]